MLRRVACDCWKAPGSSSSSYHSTSTRRPNSCKTTAAAAIVSCSSERARGAKQRAPHLVNSTAPAIASPAGTVTAAVLPAGYTVESGWCCSRGGAAAVGAGTCDSACRTALGSQLEGATAQCCCRRCPSPDGFVASCRGLQSINMGALQHSTAQGSRRLALLQAQQYTAAAPPAAGSSALSCSSRSTDSKQQLRFLNTTKYRLPAGTHSRILDKGGCALEENAQLSGAHAGCILVVASSVLTRRQCGHVKPIDKKKTAGPCVLKSSVLV